MDKLCGQPFVRSHNMKMQDFLFPLVINELASKYSKQTNQKTRLFMMGLAQASKPFT